MRPAPLIDVLAKCKTYLSGTKISPLKRDFSPGSFLVSEFDSRQLTLEREIFQMNLREDVSLKEIADYLLSGIQSQYAGVIGSILLLRDGDHLEHFSAPSLPAGFAEAINGIKPVVGAGSCGTAAATGTTIVVEDIETDPLWKDYRHLALPFGLRACWSVPIFGSQNKILGTFAFYHLQTRAASPGMLLFIQRWAQLFGVLLEYRNSQEEARQIKERYMLSMKATHDLVWDWVVGEDKVYRNEEGLRAIFGFSNFTSHTSAEWLDRIHPEDLPGVNKLVQQIREDASMRHFKIRYRFLREDGSMMHVLDRGYIQRDALGKATRVIGAAKDITKYVQFEEQLKTSEEQYRHLFESNPLPMWIFDPATSCFLQVNTTSIQNYGYTEEEFLRMTIFDIRPPDEHPRLHALLAAYKKDRQTFARGNWKHRKKNGDIIRVEIFSHRIRFKGQMAMLVLANDVTKFDELQEQIEYERNIREQQVMRATIDMQEKARQEIGYELHDNVNQMLGAAKLYLEAGEPGKPLEEEFRLESMAILQTAIDEIRRLTRSLTPPMLSEFGLTGAIEALVLCMQKVQPFQIAFCHKGLDSQSLDAKLQLAIYRIIQEQTNNIIKYAKATQVDIDVKVYSKVVHVKIRDNGVGFSPDETAKGVGFTNINNRATVYQGEVLIESAPGHGCTIHVSLKLP